MRKNISSFHIPRWEELPTVDLYLDQVVNYINDTLSPYIYYNLDSNNKEDLLTKTMINNYVKNNLIRAPKRKLYNKLHLSKLFVICVLKQVYSMPEINMLTRITLKDSTIKKTYNQFCNSFEEALKCTFEKREFNIDANGDSRLYLIKSIMLSCSYKIYVQNILNFNEEQKIDK